MKPGLVELRDLRNRVAREMGFSSFYALQVAHFGMSVPELRALTDQLVRDGLVERVDDPEDRRSYLVRLTPAGRTDFAAMAREHEQWLVSLFGGLAPGQKDTLFALLGELRLQLVRNPGLTAPPVVPL